MVMLAGKGMVTDHGTALDGARMRVRRARRASITCLLAAACVVLAASAMYLHGWRSGWSGTAILCIVVPAAVALSVLSLAFDRILQERFEADVSLLDAGFEAKVRACLAKGT